MITGITESRTLKKHASCKYECKFDDRKSNLNQNWNNDKSPCKHSKKHQCRKGYFPNPAKCGCKNGKSTSTKTVPTKVFLMESTSKATTVTKSTSARFYISIAFLLITIALLIAISIYLIIH